MVASARLRVARDHLLAPTISLRVPERCMYGLVVDMARQTRISQPLSMRLLPLLFPPDRCADEASSSGMHLLSRTRAAPSAIHAACRHFLITRKIRAVREVAERRAVDLRIDALSRS